MMIARRFLPSISSLMALEAVDRLGSATAAAAELSLTQSAVSRQLKVLEEQMGAQLFLRDGNRLRLTPAARLYAQKVRELLRGLATASLKLKANPAGGSLDLAILPAFGMHWLAPRLKDFASRHPEITVNLSTRLRPFSFASEPFDAAIHFGRRDWIGVEYLPILEEQVVAVCAPALLKQPIRRVADVLALPLLHLETRPDAWENWFARNGHPVAGLRGMLFDQFSTMAQAAIHGMGVALLPSYLAESEIRNGRLQMVLSGCQQSLGSYYLVWPTDRPVGGPLEKFQRWLKEQVGAPLQ
ncbi:LysR substrate-binding domain-containing protein [Chelativorans intermedius]|uniref:LysR substrate-binding domain-containing protein n=1 Tax=Chelativorans intermedius TaxID=515947 RepID=A0ABV6DAL8_9HYPH